MNSEETKILNQSEEIKNEETIKDTPNNKKVGTGEKVAYAAGGFAAGVASGVAGSAFAASPSDEAKEEMLAATAEVEGTTDATETEASTESTETAPVQEAPTPQEAIVATSEGVKVAQVDDDASFSEAFADARAQVGPGGVFEWRGHVYNTYYESEWENMSPAERAEYQSKIDYSAVTDGSDATANVQTTASQTEIAPNAQMVDSQPENTEVKVLGVEVMTDAEGNQATVAGLEIDGQAAIMVDVDNDGMMDVIAVDEDGNGQLTENEVYDASELNISTQDLMAQVPGNETYMAQNDGMPDYMNDADVSSLA
ncbi:MAG: hypothetical protein IJ013_07490 [Bacteroidaceae bacterium]|nr:hypothetical protein [Bacteroidaceae bacterium]